LATRLAELRDSDGTGAYAHLDDRFLVLDFQAGNEDPAFEEIHRRYSGLARHICQNILRNTDDAEEATQEAMLRVYQGLARFNGRYMVQPWVARIATNVSLDIVRARQRRPVAPLPLDHQDESFIEHEDRAPEAVVERRLEQARVNSALEALPLHHRRALVMREFEGRSHEEIARALDITPKQAKALIHRAKASFRRIWEGNHGGLAAILPVLLAPLRLPEAVRRMIGSAGGAAATSSAAAGMASPIVSNTVATAGERVAAAAVALAMVTTVGVGAVALKDRVARDAHPVRDRSPHARVVDVPASVPPSVPTSVPEVVSLPKPRPDRLARDKAHKKHTKPKPVVEQPVVEPSVIPTPSPSVDPSASPTPTETTPPPLPPAPDWSMKVSAIQKTASMTLLTSSVVGTAGKNISFSQVASGTFWVKDPILVHAEYWGSADGPNGTTGLRLYLDTANGRYRYDGTGTVESVTSDDDAKTTYVFSGLFTRTESPELDDSHLAKKMPLAGSFELTLGFWEDGTSLYVAGLSLSPVAAGVSS
jgi:RNA polymerase sigma factor (sigma-70 family)